MLTPLVVMAESFTSTKPNIVVILADDIGVGDISFYNKNIRKKPVVIETKNIDAIAQQGVWFSHAHSATALCAPTRYSMMTGKNNYRSYAPWGVWGSFRENAIRDQEPTLANVVKSQGYSTGFVGKWHLGGDFKFKDKDRVYRGTDEGLITNVDLTKMTGGGPNNLGFDYSFMLPDGIQGPLYLAYENQQWFPLQPQSKITHLNNESVINKKIISDKGDGMGDSHWRTSAIGDLLSAKAAEFIKRQNKQPFLLYYASPMAHLPHIPPVKFDNLKVKGETPSDHLDMIFELDLQVGRIVNALKESNIYNDTLIIFTSDNGGLVYRVPGTLESGHQPSGIFRGSKNTPHEGGHRVPFIASWPAKMGHKMTSNEMLNDSPVLVQDILATIAEAAGNELSRDQAPDSKSFLSLIIKQKNNSYKRRNYLMLQAGSQNQVMFQHGDWKLIINSDHKLSHFTPVALFNLADNEVENEAFNLINDKRYQAQVEQMLAQYLKIRQSGEPTRD